MFRTFSRKLAELSVASLRMDYSCNGESDGEYIDFRFDQALEDCKLMIDYGYGIAGIKEVSLLGFSMGGMIASLLSNYKPFKKLLLISPAARLAEKLRHSYTIANKDELGNVPSVAFPLTESLVSSMEKYKPYEEAMKFKGSAFIIHGNKDMAVNYLDGIEYAVKIPHASIHIVNGAGHGYENVGQFTEMVEKSIKFFK
jgi:pimeloyl-ACP methyl ester carboxylesterase